MDNAIYTPTPKTIEVCEYEGDVWIATERDRRGKLGTEHAVVVSRGNLLADGCRRWYEVRLANGKTAWVAGEGS